MTDDHQYPPDVAFAQIQCELAALAQRFDELCSRLPEHKQQSTVRYYLVGSQAALAKLALRFSRS